MVPEDEPPDWLEREASRKWENPRDEYALRLQETAENLDNWASEIGALLGEESSLPLGKGLLKRLWSAHEAMSAAADVLRKRAATEKES